MSDASPRIYYLHPLLAGPLAGWDRHFERIVRLGFDSVMIAPPFRTGRGGNLFRTADHGWIDDRLGGDAAEPALRRLAESAAGHALRLLLDLPTGSVAADGTLAYAHPDWFATLPPDSPPDPRLPPGRTDEARWRFADEATVQWWQAQLRLWQHCGVAGVLFRDAYRVPGAWWRQVLPALGGGSLAIAGATGADPTELAGLAGCGFALTVASSAWWDFRAGWLNADADRLASVAPALALAEPPFGPRVAASGRTAAEGQRLAERALALAAFYSPAWLMPMGFEYAATRRLDPARGTEEEFCALAAQAPADLAPAIIAANRRREAWPALHTMRSANVLSVPDAALAVLRRAPPGDPAQAVLLVANPSRTAPATVAPAELCAALGGLVTGLTGADDLPVEAPLTLPPAGVRLLRPLTAPPVLLPAPAPAPEAAVTAAAAPRIAIEAVAPDVDGGRFPVKRVLGETVTVTADIICDGHDHLAVVLLWRPADTAEWNEIRMTDLGNDRWTAGFPLQRLGRHEFTVAAWKDRFATYTDELEKKRDAGVPIALELEEGRRLLAQSGDPTLRELAATLEDAEDSARLAALLSVTTRQSMRAADPRPHLVRHEPPVLVDAERRAAAFAAWYEMFPRSAVGDGQTHGSFRDVIPRLPAIAAMGFDVLYFPPIHPIGRTNRKGRNNSLTPADDDPGSPYAIGSAEGGHDALHPQLGSFAEFQQLRAAAAAHGLELALDFAIQCAPDHPWLREHRDWFEWRPDGSIRYAENPPKKYQDIVNVDFYAAGAVPSLWLALRDVVLFWVGQGIRMFRVDNPHTKPLPFWEWLIGEVRGAHPETMFLAEAFTRPKMMYRLAKLGFSQSYTYFTWRHTKAELTDYLTELTTTAPREFFRPHFFVNTPDINPPFLQTTGRPGHLIRAALASLLSGLWGIYNGFEICEATPLPGREEYMDSEKYQLRAWDWQRPGNIIAEITRLNRIRGANPALHSHLGLRFHTADNDQVLLFSKSTAAGDNRLLVAVSLDPLAVQEAEIELPLWQWGLADDAGLRMEDLMHDSSFVWHGTRQRIRLDPAALPFAVWRVTAQ